MQACTRLSLPITQKVRINTSHCLCTRSFLTDGRVHCSTGPVKVHWDTIGVVQALIRERVATSPDYYGTPSAAMTLRTGGMPEQKMHRCAIWSHCGTNAGLCIDPEGRNS